MLFVCCQYGGVHEISPIQRPQCQVDLEDKMECKKNPFEVAVGRILFQSQHIAHPLKGGHSDVYGAGHFDLIRIVLFS